MSRRTEFEARQEGRRLVLRRRPAVWRATVLLAAVPVGVGILVVGWRVAENTAGPALRDGGVVLGVVLLIGLARLVRGGRP